MSDELMLKCLIAIILGYLSSRYIGNGFKQNKMSFFFTHCDKYGNCYVS